MTIGLTWRRTARRIKRLKEGVLTISPDYSDPPTPDFLALSTPTPKRSPLAPLISGTRISNRGNSSNCYSNPIHRDRFDANQQISVRCDRLRQLDIKKGLWIGDWKVGGESDGFHESD